MVHFTKDSYVITVSELEPFESYRLLQQSLATALMLIFAQRDCVPDNDPIYHLAQLMYNLSEVEQKQCCKIDKFVREL
jgi:hypothetical protein